MFEQKEDSEVKSLEHEFNKHFYIPCHFSLPAERKKNSK